MTAASGYVWFLPVYVSMKMNETGVEGLSKECTMNEVRNAMDGHFSLSYASFGEDSDVIDGSGNETIANWKEDYLRRIQANKTQYADVASYTYDAIWVYVKALKQLIKEGKTTSRDLKSFSITNKNFCELVIKFDESSV